MFLISLPVILDDGSPFIWLLCKALALLGIG